MRGLLKETFSLFSSVLELAGIQDYLKLGIDQTTAAEQSGAGRGQRSGAAVELKVRLEINV